MIRQSDFIMVRMMRISFLLFLFILCHPAVYGQSKFLTRDSTHIFWQPGLKIGLEDYRGDTTHQVMNLMRKYDFRASASIGVWSVMDIPKKPKQRKRKPEKIYIAPAFERTTSFALTDDPMELEIQNTYLDICEIWARWARERLDFISDSSGAPGMLITMFPKVMREAEEKRMEMNSRYSREVIIDKKPSALAGWRDLIKKSFEETNRWATRPEECYRLLIGRPLLRGYIDAPKSISE